MSARGYCPTCQELLALRDDGTVRRHDDRFGSYGWCSGSLKIPTETAVDWKARAEAAESRISELYRTQRTPGFIERCPECNAQPNLNAAGPQPGATCRVEDCPIRTQEKSSQQSKEG